MSRTLHSLLKGCHSNLLLNHVLGSCVMHVDVAVCCNVQVIETNYKPSFLN